MRRRWALTIGVCCLLLGGALLVMGARPGPATSVTMTWDAPTTGVPLGYTIYRQVHAGSFELLGESALEPRTFRDPVPALGENRYYVTAWNSGGESGPSNVVAVQCTKERGQRRCVVVP